MPHFDPRCALTPFKLVPSCVSAAARFTRRSLIQQFDRRPILTAGSAVVAELSSPQHETDDGQSSTGRHGVYVYNLGTAYTSGISKSPWNSGRNWDCHRTMYSMDVRLHKWLLRPDMRASSPETAAAYFIPFYQSCLRHACAKPSKLHCMWNETNQFENPSVGDGRVKALKQVMELYPWFNRSKGRDHFITLTHDLASIERIGSSFIDPLVIPDQKSQLRRIVTSSDRHRGFLRGRDYSIPPRLFAWQGVVRVNRTNRRLAADRSPDIYFRGAFDNSYSSPIRAEVWRHWGCTHEHNDSCTRQSGGQVYVMNRHAPQPNDVPYLTRLQRSRFCLHMPGHQYWSPGCLRPLLKAASLWLLSQTPRRIHWKATHFPFWKNCLWEGASPLY